MKPEPIIVVWLWLLMGGCSGSQQPSKMSGSEAMESSSACYSPDQAGCTECCVEQRGPGAGDQICYRRAISEGRAPADRDHEYAEAAAFLNRGSCPATCRPCAACTRDQKKSYQQLLSKGCDCLDPFVREVVGSIDPCFSDGCGCICSRLRDLSQCGPPI